MSKHACLCAVDQLPDETAALCVQNFYSLTGVILQNRKHLRKFSMSTQPAATVRAAGQCLAHFISKVIVDLR